MVCVGIISQGFFDNISGKIDQNSYLHSILQDQFICKIIDIANKHYLFYLPEWFYYSINYNIFFKLKQDILLLVEHYKGGITYSEIKKMTFNELSDIIQLTNINQMKKELNKEFF